MTENPPEELQEDPQEPQEDEQSVDELEQKLIDAVRSLNRKNKMVEEYLDSLGKPADKPAANPEPPKN
jgi:hypothetical protein